MYGTGKKNIWAHYEGIWEIDSGINQGDDKVD